MALPEIADAKRDAARGPTHIAQAARAMALCGVEPRVAVGGAFADGERIRVGLQSVQSPNAGMYCSRLLAAGAIAGTARPAICASRAGFPGSRRSPVRPRTASANRP